MIMETVMKDLSFQMGPVGNAHENNKKTKRGHSGCYSHSALTLIGAASAENYELLSSSKTASQAVRYNITQIKQCCKRKR